MIAVEEISQETWEEELANSRSMIEKLNRLLGNEDFKFLNAHQQTKLDSLVMPIFTPPQGVDSELVNLYRRGHIAGFQEAMNYLQLLLQGAKGAVERLAPREPKKEDM